MDNFGITGRRIQDILVTVEVPFTTADGGGGVLTFRDRVHAHVLESIAQLDTSGMKVTYTKQATISVPVKPLTRKSTPSR